MLMLRTESRATTFPQNLALTLLAPVFSFYLVEQPIRKLRERRAKTVMETSQGQPSAALVAPSNQGKIFKRKRPAPKPPAPVRQFLAGPWRAPVTSAMLRTAQRGFP